jgi:hypothetical protein
VNIDQNLRGAFVSYFQELFRRMGRAWRWVIAQFAGTLLLVLAGVAWTRLPDKHAWQVLLTLALPLVLLAALLALEAGTMRKLLDAEERRVRFVWGALMLLGWIALGLIAWMILDWCGDQTDLWASYLNSIAPAAARARLFSNEHIQHWLAILIWIVRWIVVPGKLIPLAVESAQCGWRLPCGKLLRAVLNWRWWIAVVPASLLAVALPCHFFAGTPHGTATHQVWAVVLKLAATYLLAMVSWIMLLAWSAVLLARTQEPAADALDQDLFRRFYAARKWLGGIAIVAVCSELSGHLVAHLPGGLGSSVWIDVPVTLILLILALWFNVGLLRGLIGPNEKRVRVIWGSLMSLAWVVPGLAAAIVLSDDHGPAVPQAFGWLLVAGLLIPFAAASAQWGVRLPWRRVFRILFEWRWWLGVLTALIVGLAIPLLLLPSGWEASPLQTDLYPLRLIVGEVLAYGSWILLAGWFAVLLGRTQRGTNPSAELPLPKGGDGAGGQA